MANPIIKIKRSTTTATAPVVYGEIAYTNIGGVSKVFIGNSSNAPVEIAGDSFAKLDSPTFTGTPVAPTAAAGTNTTQVATTAYVYDAVTTGKVLPEGQILVGNASGVQTATTLTSGQVLLGNASGFATPTTVTGDVTIAASGSTTIGAGAVTGLKIASETVTGGNIASATITGAKIASATVTGGNIASATVTGGNIASETVTGGNIASATVTGGNIASETIIGGNIASATITGAKIAAQTLTNSLFVTAPANTWKGSSASGPGVADNMRGALTETGSSVLTITGGALALLNSASIQVKESSATVSGFLSNTDWAAFNAKASVSGTTEVGGIAIFDNTTGQIRDAGYSVETTVSGSSTKIPTSSAVLASIQASQQGLSVKQSVLAATHSYATFPGSLNVVASGSGVGKTLTASVNGLLSIDGINTWVDVTTDGGSVIPEDLSPTSASRVLIKNQSNAVDNGIYVVTTKGSATTKFVLTRALDANSSLDLNNGAFVFVETGTMNAGAGFVLTTVNPTIDTSGLNFVQFSGAGSITAGTGIAVTGNTVSIATGGVTTTQIAFNTIRGGNIAAETISSGNILNATITGAKIASNTITGGNIANATITSAQLATSIAGNGLEGGAGAGFSVKADTTTGATVAPVNVTANGVGTKLDNISIVHTIDGLEVGTVDGGTF